MIDQKRNYNAIFKAKIDRCNVSNLLESFRILGKRLSFWSHGYDYIPRCMQIFGKFDFHGRNILEIGCGKGIFCIWAAIHGAKHVVGLEPFAEGSHRFKAKETYNNFEKIKQFLKLWQMEMLPLRLEDYRCRDNYYDLILSVNSINHLDEESCKVLAKSQKAVESYLKIFYKIRDMMKNGGKLIIIDVSNRNFFGDHKMKNPFAKSIEWSKHQDPVLWAKLLSRCGFAKCKISWNSSRMFRYLKIYSIPKTMSYFYDSCFRLEMTCSK